MLFQSYVQKPTLMLKKSFDSLMSKVFLDRAACLIFCGIDLFLFLIHS